MNVGQSKGVKEIHEGKAYTDLCAMICALYLSKIENTPGSNKNTPKMTESGHQEIDIPAT